MDIFGVEIRADALAVAHLKSTLLGVKVQGYEVLRGDTLKARVEGLRSHISGKAVKDPRISVVLPRNAVISRVIEVPAPDAGAIGQILRFEIEKHIPFKVEEAYWGFEPVGKNDKVFSVLIAAASKSTVDRVVTEFTAAGIAPRSVCFWQASVVNALKRWKNSALSSDAAIVGLDSGAVTVDVISGLAPVYSKTISGAALKDDGGSAAVKRELGAFLRSSVARGKRYECAVLCGEALEAGLVEALSSEPNMTVGAVRLKGLTVPQEAAPALGAAISAIGKGSINIDLLASQDAVKVPEYLKTMALFAAVIVLAVLTGATYLVKDWVTLKMLDSALSEARLQKEKVDGLAAELKAADERIKTLEGIKGLESPGALEVLKELSVVLPGGTWLTGLEYNGGVAFIEGFSERASAELLKMERSTLLKDAEFAGPVTRGRDGKEHFRIRFSVRGNGSKKAGKDPR